MRIADASEVRAHLLAAARAGVAITYSELLGQLGYPFSRPKMRALCKTLAAVDAKAEASGEPELAVLVVRQSDGLPGQGWWVGGAAQHGHEGPWEGPEAKALVARLQGQAFDYWSCR
ncbi:MAG TPA: ribose-phosphate pyrophosphokinase [Sphingomicrobium sp.]|nr:ribose-phosphate pyrophosphokinase [Sphingomicrobium sp.]